jgi:hypothetical protein
VHPIRMGVSKVADAVLLHGSWRREEFYQEFVQPLLLLAFFVSRTRLEELPSLFAIATSLGDNLTVLRPVLLERVADATAC